MKIYRADSYKSETTTPRRLRAHENFCPVKIFSPGRDGAEPEQNESQIQKKKEEKGEKKRKAKETNCPASKTETSTLRSKRRKLDRREKEREKEFTEARFMDYRSSARDLSCKPSVLAELSREREEETFRQKKLHTPRTKTRSNAGKKIHGDFVRRKREERRREAIIAVPRFDIQRAATRSQRDPIRASVNQESRARIYARARWRKRSYVVKMSKFRIYRIYRT